MPSAPGPSAPRRLFKGRAAWRAWLAAHHATAREIWIVYYKKGVGKTSVTYLEALEEALCYGWIDSTVNRLDDERYMQRYTPRRPKSVWSAANKARVARLARAGRMARPGLDAVATAKRNGSWASLDAADRPDPDAPPDLLAALALEPRAHDAFDRAVLSQKKMYVWWVLSAKRPETRARRIARAVAMLAAGIKLGIGTRTTGPI